jgi:hypothetical protein
LSLEEIENACKAEDARGESLRIGFVLLHCIELIINPLAYGKGLFKKVQRVHI